MRYRSLDETGDYTFGKNDFKTGKEAVAQAIQTRISLLYGQWWENVEDGLLLFENILGVSGSHQESIDMLLTERILNTKHVKEIKRYESTFVNRIYTAVCVVETVYGEVSVEIGKGVQFVWAM